MFFSQTSNKVFPDRYRPFEYILSESPKIYLHYPTIAVNSIIKNGVVDTNGKIIKVSEEDIDMDAKETPLTWDN